ncbi:MAG: hypothetical protein COT15_02865 [Candidatus Diapherotrites archaeon CG08_land_8_20_14_0_20_34_12]|nr:MAG: hypothetical protein COT15_02865 [Candidatus Diapherotrites archaeon CG08_land_8_20_14_0_20_34_12]
MSYCTIPLDQRQIIYDKVFSLKQNGLSYKKIIEQILSEFRIKLHKSTLSYWFNNNVKLVGGENYFNSIASPELSYVLGVMFGDGAITFNKKKQDYAIRLEAKDKDFVENFSTCVSKVLNKNRNYLVCKTKREMYSVKGRSKQLYYFIKSLKEDFELLKKFVEPFPAEFIRGVLDSEGTISASPKKYLKLRVYIASSANLELLKYLRDLLFRNFMIKTILSKTKTAGMIDSVIDGRVIRRTKDLFQLAAVNEEQAILCCELIGSAISRKIKKFEDFIFLRKRYTRLEAAILWQKIYHKEGRFWIRNNTKSIDSFLITY